MIVADELGPTGLAFEVVQSPGDEETSKVIRTPTRSRSARRFIIQPMRQVGAARTQDARDRGRQALGRRRPNEGLQGAAA